MIKKIALLAYAFVLQVAICEGANLCGEGQGSWVAFSDSKCFKVIQEVVTRDEALAICARQETQASNIPSLAKIGSQTEQDFLTKYAFETLGIVDNLWIAARRNGTQPQEFIWDDGTPLGYQNWAENFPTTIPGRDCVTMKSKLNRAADPQDGEWTDGSCNARNAIVLCQKWQVWSLVDLQRKVLQLAKELEDTKAEIVPIGTIYVQLALEKSPAQIWPTLTWEDISSAYEGLFFRVAGGLAADVGQVQEGNAPKINQMESATTQNSNDFTLRVEIPSEGLSDWLWVGYNHVADFANWETLRLHNVGGEVRPRNTAMRIWRRTA